MTIVSSEHASLDGWPWLNEGSIVVFVDDAGHIVHKIERGFVRKKRLGRHYVDSEVTATECVMRVQETRMTNKIQSNYRKRISTVMQVHPEEKSFPSVCQYKWFGRTRPFHLPMPDGAPEPKQSHMVETWKILDNLEESWISWIILKNLGKILAAKFPV